MPKQNAFLERLAKTLAATPLGETLLVAPSNRVGRQWLDAVTLRLGAVAGVRIVTLRRLVHTYAAPLLAEQGLRLDSREKRLERFAGVMRSLRNARGEEGYFSALPPSASLVETLLGAVDELEMAEMKTGKRFAEGFASRQKADELRRLLAQSRAADQAAGVALYHQVCLAACEALGRAAETPLLLLPQSLVENALPLEARFLKAWPKNRKQILPENSGAPDADLLAFRADCPADEIRRIFRIIQENSLPLDQVEILLPPGGDYLQTLFSVARETFGGRVEDLPLTANAGIPGLYSRPARLLAAWLDWLENDLPPLRLAEILWSGLLDAGWKEAAPNVSAGALAERLLTLPINAGPEDYQLALARQDGGDAMAAALRWLAACVWEIVPVDPADRTRVAWGKPRAVLAAALKLLDYCRAGNAKLDSYAHKALVIMLTAQEPCCEWEGFNAFAWLEDNLAGMNLMGMGPAPGKVHVADWYSGGHSDRGWTFVTGLDDARYPGNVRQDPVLLDDERLALTELSRNKLEPAGESRRRREKAMRRLMARLAGTVVLSHAAGEGVGGRELFPSALFSRLAAALPEERREGTAVLRPEEPEGCLNRRDDWLFHLLAKDRNTLTPEALAGWYPGLAAGERAAAARRGGEFGPWDGRVPEAGGDFLENLPVLSPSNLEELARCPLEFFFHKILAVKPAERYRPEPGQWLAANERGDLLHGVFQDFLGEMAREGRKVGAEETDDARLRLLTVLERELARWRRRRPPRDELAFNRERDELYEACVIFLVDEEERARQGRPLCLEAELGGARVEARPWNRVEPVELSLPSGLVLPLRGRVDRIDRLDDGGGLAIVDYKTGSAKKFSREDPFRGGRCLQPFLYARMLKRVTEEAGIPEPVRSFSFYFPMPRDEGRTIAYSWERLSEGGWEVVEALAGLLRRGYFPFTTEANDVQYSDYAAAFGGEAKDLAAAVLRKCEGVEGLEEWAAMRGEGL